MEEWISPKDQLPAEYENCQSVVLVWWLPEAEDELPEDCWAGNPSIANIYYVLHGIDKNLIKYWMPLPMPPELI